jgi:plastocyanin domain-containing protein
MASLKTFVALSFVVMFCLVVAAQATTSASGAKPSAADKKVQVVKLTFDDKGYVVTPSTVTKGVPVRMDVDLATVKGCMRTVVINAFNVKQTVKDGATTIEFTPSKSGKIDIICGMNMGKGSFTVAEPK